MNWNNLNIQQLFTPIALNSLLQKIKIPNLFFVNQIFSKKKTTYDAYLANSFLENDNEVATPTPETAEATVLANKDIRETADKLPIFREKKLLPFESLHNYDYAIKWEIASTLANKIEAMKKRILMAKEYMCSQVLTQFKIVYNNYTNDFGGKNSHKKKITNNADKWATAGGAKILEDLSTAVDTIKKDYGIAPNTLILGANVLNTFLLCEEIQKIYTNRRYVIGEIAPEENYVGNIFINGCDLKIYTTSNTITNNNNEINLLNPNTTIVMNRDECYFVNRIPPYLNQLYSMNKIEYDKENIYITKSISDDPQGIWLFSYYSGIPQINLDSVYVIEQ